MVWDQRLNNPGAAIAASTPDVRPETEPFDDEAVAERAKQNPAEFAPLYRRYAANIYGYCLLRLASRELAEDATSLTFERALAALPRYRAHSFRGWLFRIAHNVVVDQQRARPPIQLDHTLPAAANDESPETAAMNAEADRRVLELLDLLTPDQREVVEFDLAGLSGPEIAEALGRRQGAIRAIRFRAYSRLRGVLSEGNES